MKTMMRLTCVAAMLLSAACNTTRITIAGTSMEPTLRNGEHLVASRNVDALSRGDIVGFRYPKDESKSFVQRIIGVPGDRIEMRDGILSLNGRTADEPFVTPENRSHDTWGPLTVPDGQYFMMGDHRNNSSDSRSWGLVNRAAIWAKIIVP